MGIRAFIKDPLGPCPLQPVRIPEVFDPAGALTRPPWHPQLRLPGSRTASHKLQSVVSPPVCDSMSQRPRGTQLVLFSWSFHFSEESGQTQLSAVVRATEVIKQVPEPGGTGRDCSGRGGQAKSLLTKAEEAEKKLAC